MEEIKKLNAFKLGLATGIVLAVIWVVCSILVVLMPLAMMQMGGHMLHADFGAARWAMNWGGFVIGLVLWSLLGGLQVWAVAAVYNRLLG